MSCTSFFASWITWASSLCGSSTAPLVPTQTMDLEYCYVQPMTQVFRRSEQEIRDVIEVETMIGISFFSSYRGFVMRERTPYLLFSARFQKSPQNLHLISCPLCIRAPTLSPSDRHLLQLKLDVARDWVPESHWRLLGIGPHDSLLVSE